LAKNLVGLYRRGLLGELHQNFSHDVPYRGTKFSAYNLVAFLPKMLEPISTTPFFNFIANISSLEQDIVNRKTALQTAMTAVHVYQIW